MRKGTAVCCSALLMAGLFALALLVCPTHFLLDDDTLLMQLLSGARTGEASYYNVYNSILYSAPISALYRLFPAVEWYPLIQIFILFASGTAVCSVILPLARERGRALPVLLAGIGVFLCMWLPNLIFLQYSVVGAAAGTAACLLALSRMERGGRGWGIAIFGALSFCIRVETGVAMLAMLCAAGLMGLLSGEKAEWKGKIKSLLGPLVPWVLVGILTLGLGLAIEHGPEMEDYAAFNHARRDYMDYPHDDFSENPVFLETGWNRSLYDLVEHWCFLDPRVNTENLHQINAAAVHSFTPLEKLTAAPGLFFSTLGVSNLVRNLFLLLVGLTLALLARRLLGLDVPGLIRGLVPLLAFFAASLLLCYRGRFSQHAFYVVALPALMLLLYEWADLPKAGKLSGCLGGLALFATLFLGVNSAEHVVALANSPVILEEEALNDRINAYARSHGDKIILTDYSLRVFRAPFAPQGEPWARNRFSWGGWYYHSPFYYDQLKENGLSTLTGEALYGGRVLLLNRDEALLQNILAYLSENFGPTELMELDRLGDVGIYTFVNIQTP